MSFPIPTLASPLDLGGNSSLTRPHSNRLDMFVNVYYVAVDTGRLIDRKRGWTFSCTPYTAAPPSQPSFLSFFALSAFNLSVHVSPPGCEEPMSHVMLSNYRHRSISFTNRRRRRPCCNRSTPTPPLPFLRE